MSPAHTHPAARLHRTTGQARRSASEAPTQNSKEGATLTRNPKTPRQRFWTYWGDLAFGLAVIAGWWWAVLAFFGVV